MCAKYISIHATLFFLFCRSEQCVTAKSYTLYLRAHHRHRREKRHDGTKNMYDNAFLRTMFYLAVKLYESKRSIWYSLFTEHLLFPEHNSFFSPHFSVLWHCCYSSTKSHILPVRLVRASSSVPLLFRMLIAYVSACSAATLRCPGFIIIIIIVVAFC